MNLINPRFVRASIVFVTFFAVVPQLVAQCPVPAPTAYWPMEGTATEAMHGFPGVVIGNVQFVGGMAGQAASFDGDFSYIDAGFHAALSGSGGSAFTFSAWLNPLPDPQATSGDVPGNDSHAVVVTARTFCNEGNWQFYNGLFGTLYASKWFQGDESFFHSGVAIPFDSWSHVVVTYSEGVARFYVNGELAQEVTDDFVIPVNSQTQSVQIGWDSCSSYYTGRIDELAFYERALSPAEIRLQYVRGSHGVPLCPGAAHRKD